MASTAMPTRDDFAKLLNETLGGENEGFEGKVVKGTVTGIENDMAVIDVGLKSEGRVSLREFAAPGQKAEIKVGDVVDTTRGTLELRSTTGNLLVYDGAFRYSLDGTVAPEAATPAAEDIATQMAPAKKPARARKTPDKPAAAPDSAEPAPAAAKRSRTKSAS